ncbi:hypothetical protein [Pontibacter cellulosilyticus]|uniref:Uncharacterized protein n=1 Tax=Pontibacter cellulosilyticus TaxID=1720253 RepID=A0A923N4C9_9BACT|nr:hypothetical protein [Pontibacter cellulosilyticus]MBC5991939.1 hypothetical protein [Pontibacter cellulosilyticus]
MKGLFICLVSLFISVPALTQKLTLRNLLKLRQMEVPEIDRKLTQKGWEFISDSKPTDGVMGKAVWAYNPNLTREGTMAWCVLYYSNNSPSRILYNVSPDKAIQRIQEKFRLCKMRPISEGNKLEGVEQLEYYADYPDPRYMFRLLKYKQVGYSGIKIFEKADYEIARSNGRL